MNTLDTPRDDDNAAWNEYYSGVKDEVESELDNILTSATLNGLQEHAKKLAQEQAAEAGRNKFFLNALQVKTLVEVLTEEGDEWHRETSDFSLHFFNVINISNYFLDADYMEDWNTSVRYHKDNGEWYESADAEFTITPLGEKVENLFNEDGSFKKWQGNEYELRFLVEAPVGLDFRTMESYLIWVISSIRESFGPRK
jgi:hypothetical protein